MSNRAEILLVEDSDTDAELTAIAFEDARIGNPITRVRDGVEALDYLFGRGQYAGRNIDEPPAIVLLDLNLPRLGGIEVLKAIRAHERLRLQPVIILTASDDDQDKLAAGDFKANSFIRKPVDREQFVECARQLGLYWLITNLAPPRI
jgi:two-component system response regulator